MHQRERELASQCSLTLITEADHEFHSFLRSLLHANPLLVVPQIHYDLISLPTFHGLEHDIWRRQMLIENISLAIDVHSAEKVLLLQNAAEAIDVYCWLKRELGLKFSKLRFDSVLVRGFEAQREPSRRLVVTCMDFRLHHEAGLQGMFTEFSAWLTYPGAALAGVDSQTEEVFFSDIDRVLDREAVDELTLVSHTDCAKYAAKHSWRNIKEEINRLGNDLRLVASRIRSRYGRLTVFCAIAVIKDGGVLKLISI